MIIIQGISRQVGQLEMLRELFNEPENYKIIEFEQSDYYKKPKSLFNPSYITSKQPIQMKDQVEDQVEEMPVMNDESCVSMGSKSAIPDSYTISDKEAYGLREKLVSIAKTITSSDFISNRAGILDSLYKEFMEVNEIMNKDYQLYKTQPFLSEIRNQVDVLLREATRRFITTLK